MKHNNQHIIKKSYTKPVIEEVMVDVAVSLQSLSKDPDGDPSKDGPITNPDDLPSPTSIGPDYQIKNPFGGNSPNYK